MQWKGRFYLQVHERHAQTNSVYLYIFAVEVEVQAKSNNFHTKTSTMGKEIDKKKKIFYVDLNGKKL